MQKYPCYKKYKESGQLFPKEIPSHWNISKITYDFEVQLGKMIQPEPKSVSDEFLPYLRSANLQWEGVDLSSQKLMWFNPQDRINYRLKPGDLLISEGGDVGRSSYWERDDEMYIQNAVNRVRRIVKSDTKFLYYWMRFIKSAGFIDIICDSSTIAHYTAEKVKATFFLQPKLEEQQSIAKFLDQKTAQIDALIGQKEKLLKLLTEKRTAIIIQAVTKGLDPKVKMKDSGIEWLGKVPEHWIVKKLKYLSSYIKTGITPSSNGPDYFSEGTVNWYAPGDFDGEAITLASSSKKLDETVFLDTGQRKFPAYSVLVVGIGATLGKVGMALEECTSNQQINAIYPSEKFDSKFLTYFLITQNDIMKLVSNSTTLGIMNQEKTKNLFVATPPIEEQTKIVQSLDIVIGKIDDLKSKTRHSIEKLKEYRSALITSAVTGQIDVRKEVA